MKLTAIERGEKRPGDYRPKAEAKAKDAPWTPLVARCIALCGDNQYELARRLDVTNRAPGHWLHGRHRPSKKYMQRMQEMVDYE